MNRIETFTSRSAKDIDRDARRVRRRRTGSAPRLYCARRDAARGELNEQRASFAGCVAVNKAKCLFQGNLVQRYDAVRHDRTPHHGEPWVSVYAGHSESSSARFRELFMRGGESTWQESENFATNRKAEASEFSFSYD